MPEFTLSNLKITGFRGITVQQDVPLGNPLTVILGQNRNGKSSIANAIEWCLFGPEVAQIKYGEIRERETWEVKNLNSPACHVQCEFQSSDGKTLSVKRTFKTAKTSDISWEIKGGEKSTDEKKLHAFLRISSTDFVSSVHLHPETLRSLIIAKPKDRKEAIDRLLGLSELRDMVEAFASQKPNDWTTALDHDLEVLDGKLTTALSEKKRTIDTESTDLISQGVAKTDLTPEGALSYALELLNELQKFADRYHLTAPSIPTPADFTAIQQFRNQLPTVIEKLRNEHPALADQGKHLIQKSTLEGLRSSHASQLKKLEDAKLASTSHPEKRSVTELKAELTSNQTDLHKIEAEIREVSRNAKVLDEALTFFQNRTLSDRLACPVCGETTHSVEEWRAHIQKEISDKNLQPLRGRKEELAEKKITLEKAIEEKENLQNKIVNETSKLSSSVKNIEKAINRAISESDDPIAILNSEISALSETLASMQGQIQALNSSFTDFQSALLNLDRFQRIGNAHQEKAKIEAINDNDAYKQLKAIRKEADQHAEDEERLIEGLKSSVNSEAQKRLTNVQKAVSDTFSRLTNRPDYPGLKVSAVGDGFAIELTNQSEILKAVPILNHADINCAALSIFLALASSSQIAHRLGIVILDDPSQSLDIVCKKNLCQALSDLCDSRQVILATADNELGVLAKEMHKNKMLYNVKDWTPKGGPVIEAEATSAAHAI